jgi:hypothetical protein
MTLILGAICEDGAVIVADRKIISQDTGVARYDIPKLHRVGSIAFGIAGQGFFEKTAAALSKQINEWLEFNPKIHLGIIVHEICKKLEKILIIQEANLHIIIANKDFLYSITAFIDEHGIVRYRYEEVESIITGIDNVKFLPYKGADITDGYADVFKRIIRLNKGTYVGGRTQTIILKNNKTPLQLTTRTSKLK